MPWHLRRAYLEGLEEERIISNGGWAGEEGQTQSEQQLASSLGGAAHRTVEVEADVIDLAAMKRELEVNRK